MQRLLLIILVSFFLTTSCGKSIPTGILPEKQMIELMTEVHTIDGYLNTLPIDSSRRLIDGLYGQVFDKYNLDSLSFQQNVTYYLGNSVQAKEIYAEVIKNLNAYEHAYRRDDSTRNMIATDSLRRVNYFNKQKDEAHKLIFEYPNDTLNYDHLGAFAEQMQIFGLRISSTVKTVSAPSRSNEQPARATPVGVQPTQQDTARYRPLQPIRPQREVQ